MPVPAETKAAIIGRLFYLRQKKALYSTKKQYSVGTEKE